MTFDEKLARALGEAFDERMERRRNVPQKHRFSLAYQLWEYKTLRGLQKNRINKRWVLRRARYIVSAAIVAVSLLMGVSAYAAGLAIVRANTDSFKNFFESILSNVGINVCYGLDENSGWTLWDADISETEVSMTYNKREASLSYLRWLSFRQEIIGGNTEYADIEGKSAEPVTVFETKDGLFVRHDEEECSLYWIYDGYLFELRGNITKEEALNLAILTKKVRITFID